MPGPAGVPTGSVCCHGSGSVDATANAPVNLTPLAANCQVPLTQKRRVYRVSPVVKVSALSIAMPYHLLVSVGWTGVGPVRKRQLGST